MPVSLSTLTICFCAFLLCYFVIQAWMSWRMLRVLHASPPASDPAFPRTAIILCLRGADPFTAECIRHAATQDYPNFLLKIIVDHKLDPAMPLVTKTLASLPDASHVMVECLEAPSGRCSLKCSSLVQAEAGLPEDVEVVALLDADAVPHPTWLRELTAPLADPQVAAVTGHRWFMPSHPTVAAAVRYYWNCAAIIQMHLFEIAWGGSLAIRRDAIRKLDLPARWGKAFCEDTMLTSALRERDLKLQFAPRVMMVNRESCSQAGFFEWVRRQLLTARLYHPRWRWVVLHGLLVPAAPLAAFSLIGILATQQEWMLASVTAGVTVIYFAGLFSILGGMEWAVRKTLAGRGQQSSWLTTRAWLSLLLAIPVIQFVYPIALLAAMAARKVAWRGVTYHIRSPWDIRRQAYERYKADSRPSGHSL